MANKTSFYNGSAIASNQTNAIQSSVDAAAASEAAALASQNSAAIDAATAATKAAEASASASASETSNAASATSKSASETAASNAASSASSASTSASTATTKASEAATSSTESTASASTATTKASEAATSAAASETSRLAAAASLSSAASSASSITALVSTATTKAAEAATSAGLSDTAKVAAEAAAVAATALDATFQGYLSTASDHASNAGTSEGSAEDAQGFAVAAQGLAEDAQGFAVAAQANAESARDLAQDALVQFRSVYIGASATVPTNDGNGDALTDGDLYYNTTQHKFNVYNASTSAFEQTTTTNTATQLIQGLMSAADKVKIDGIQAGADITTTAAVIAAGAIVASDLTSFASVAAIDQGLATTDGVTFSTTAVTNYSDYTPITSPAYQEGRIFYDNSLKTLSYRSDIPDVTHEIGIEEHQRVYNSTAVTITKGSPLYFSGNYTSGGIDVPTVGLADATDETAYNVQGLAAHDIVAGAYGYCIVSGQLHGVDTSSLTAGANFYVGLTPGTKQSQSPVYPNFPMCIGWVVNSDATNGVLLVNQQNHSVNSFRVRTSVHVGSDLQVDGDFTVLGTTTSVSTADVTAGAPFYRANEGDAIGEAGTDATGVTGLDDAFFAGHFTGTATTTYYVKIDSVGTPDTFAVSGDNFATTISTGNAITGSQQMIHSLDNISVAFGSTTGHTLNDVWTGTAGPVNVDSGFFTNFNTGASGTGYSHTGFFYDASNGKWTLLSEYDPVPAGVIDVAHPSAVYGTIKAATFEGDLNGNIPNAVSFGGAIFANSTTTLRGAVSVVGTFATPQDLTMVGPTGTLYTTGDLAALNAIKSGDIQIQGGEIVFNQRITAPWVPIPGSSYVTGWDEPVDTHTRISQDQVYTPKVIVDEDQGIKFIGTGDYHLRYSGGTGTAVFTLPSDHTGTAQTQGRSIAMSLILG